MINRISRLAVGLLETNCYFIYPSEKDKGNDKNPAAAVSSFADDDGYGNINASDEVEYPAGFAKEKVISNIPEQGLNELLIIDTCSSKCINMSSKGLESNLACGHEDTQLQNNPLEHRIPLKKDKIPAIVVDPGADIARINKHLNERDLYPALVVLTHSHFDHFGAASELNCPIAAHPKAAAFLAEPSLNMSISQGLPLTLDVNFFIDDGSLIKFNGDTLEIIHTPGHSPGSICIIFDKIVLTGDTLFKQGFGRFDLPGGNIVALKESLRKLLKRGFIRALPGHGPETDFKEASNSLSFFI